MKFQQELLSIFRVYQFCGFAPFPLPLDMKKSKSTPGQNKWYIYNGIIVIFFAALVLHNMISIKTYLEGSDAQMLTYLSFIVISLVRLLAVAIAIESIINSKQQIKLLLKLENIDRIFMEDLSIKPNYKRMRRIAFFWLAIWLIKSVILITLVMADVMNADISEWDRFMWFILTIPVVISTIRYFQIIQYIRSLGYRFEMINTRLNDIFESTNRLNTSVILTKKENTEHLEGENPCTIDDGIYEDIVSLRMIFHILWECTGQLNKAFRWSLLLLITTSFFVIVVNYYRTLVWLLIDRDKEETNIIVLYFFWSAAHVFCFINLSSICYNVLKQVK